MHEFPITAAHVYIEMSLYWEFPWVPWNPMGMGIAELISWEWEWERLDGNGREWKLHTFPFPVRGRLAARQWCYCYISFSGNFSDSDTLDCHSPPAKKRPDFDFNDLCDQKTINSNAAMNWQNMSTRMGMGAGRNGNNQWEWEGNGNKTRLNLGSGMGMIMNHWEWERIGLKKTFPLITAELGRLRVVYWWASPL